MLSDIQIALIDQYVDKYIEYVNKDPEFYKKDELYKFKAVETFQREFDLDKTDLHSMVKAALRDTVNLTQAGNYFPQAVLLQFVEQEPDFMREQLKLLLDGSGPVKIRIDKFIDNTKKLKRMDENTFFDARFFSFLLACYKANDYIYVKDREFRKLANILIYDLPRGSTVGCRYEILLNFAGSVRDALKQNRDFLNVHNGFVKDFKFKDENLGWGTLDFIYNIVRRIIDTKTKTEKEVQWNKRMQSFNRERGEALLDSDDDHPENENKTADELLKAILAYKQKGSGYKITDGQSKQRKDSSSQKAMIRKLYDYRCQVCGFTFEYINKSGKKRKYVEVDHIKDKVDGGTEEGENLWALCPNCHAKKTLGVITIDIKNKLVKDGGKVVNITNKHLWHKKE